MCIRDRQRVADVAAHPHTLSGLFQQLGNDGGGRRLAVRAGDSDDRTFFFGDRTFEGGNDYELAHALLKLENTQVVQVASPEDVLMYLKNNG